MMTLRRREKRPHDIHHFPFEEMIDNSVEEL